MTDPDSPTPESKDYVAVAAATVVPAEGAKPTQNAEQKRTREAILDATTPIVIANTLSKLATKYGTERVLAEVKRWTGYVEGVLSRNDDSETRW